MAKMKVEKTTQLDPQTAYGKVRNFVETDETLRKLDGKYSCEFNDTDRVCKAKGAQFVAVLSVHPEGSGSKVTVEIELPFALTLFKGKIQEMLDHKLQKTLG